MILVNIAFPWGLKRSKVIKRRVLLSFLVLLLTSTFSWAQSFWLETGLAYSERLLDGQANQNFEAFAKLGIKAVFPVTENLSLYINPFWQGSPGLDGGLWIDFPGNIQDLEGFHSFAALGLSYLGLPSSSSSTGQSQIDTALGFALVAGISYELTDKLRLSLIYTHHPILSPSLSQAFDLSIGLGLVLDP